jgi:hypothetical protein
MPIKVIQTRKFDANHLTARDVFVIVPLVLGLFVLEVVFAFLVSDDTYIRWGGLAVDTAVLFAYFFNVSRPFLKSRRFLILAVCLLLLHLTGWIVLLIHVEEWRLAWFTAMILELPVFLHLRSRLNFIEPE